MWRATPCIHRRSEPGGHRMPPSAESARPAAAKPASGWRVPLCLMVAVGVCWLLGYCLVVPRYKKTDVLALQPPTATFDPESGLLWTADLPGALAHAREQGVLIFVA